MSGAERGPAPTPAPPMLRATLTAGGTFGFLAGMPWLDVLNMATCCSLVGLAGFVAARLYSRDCRRAGVEFRPGTGAMVGLIAGAFTAGAWALSWELSRSLVGLPAWVAWLEAFERWTADMSDLPPEFFDNLRMALDAARSPQVGLFPALLNFFQFVLIGAVLSTAGGLIGGTVFRVSAAEGPSADGRDGHE